MKQNMNQNLTDNKAAVEIEKIIMILEDMIPGSINDKFCSIINIAGVLLLNIYKNYRTLSNYNNKELFPLPDDICVIISNYLDCSIYNNASYYNYHLSLGENISYYNELVKQVQCRELMEKRRCIAKEINTITDTYKRNQKYIAYILSCLDTRVNEEYKNRTIISDIKINSIVIGFLDDATIISNYDYYLHLLDTYYILCDDISYIKIR